MGMTTYRISGSYFVAGIIIDGDLVMQAAPILGWTVGKDWGEVMSYFRRKGWAIEPVENESNYRTQWVDTEEASYEIKWVGKTCLRITKHVEGYPAEDVTAGDLPWEVTEALE